MTARDDDALLAAVLAGVETSIQATIRNAAQRRTAAREDRQQRATARAAGLAHRHAAKLRHTAPPQAGPAQPLRAQHDTGNKLPHHGNQPTGDPMILITADDLTAAEHTAAQAEDARATIEREFARGAVNTRSHDRLHDARMTAEHAAARLRTLREDYAAQQGARDARAAAGRAAAKDMTPTARSIATAREDAVHALAAAEQSMAAALAALAAYDTQVRDASAELRRRGLTAGDGEETGGARDGGLRLDGQQWLPVDGPSLLVQCLSRVVAGVAPRHVLSRMRWPSCGEPRAAAGGVSLLEECGRVA